MPPGLRFPSLPDLRDYLKRLTGQIPAGTVTTYGDLADALGDRRASRWVGASLLCHRHDGRCHCHRVVRADGQLGKYGLRGEAAKRAALRHEGVATRLGRVDLERYRFTGFQTERPLSRLRETQLRVRDRVSLEDPCRLDRIGGVDVSYGKSLAVAAYVELDPISQAVVYRRLLEQRIEFPYIPTYLAFRELPIVLDLFAAVRREHSMADVVMVDGSGILHPLRAGTATMIGLFGDVPTIGVTKSHLFGRAQWDERSEGLARCVIDPHDGTPLGSVLRGQGASRKPLYVSPGQQISVDTATAITRRAMTNRRLPTPIYWADRLSRSAVSK